MFIHPVVVALSLESSWVRRCRCGEDGCERSGFVPDSVSQCSMLIVYKMLSIWGNSISATFIIYLFMAAQNVCVCVLWCCVYRQSYLSVRMCMHLINCALLNIWNRKNSCTFTAILRTTEWLLLPLRERWWNWKCLCRKAILAICKALWLPGLSSQIKYTPTGRKCVYKCAYECLCVCASCYRLDNIHYQRFIYKLFPTKAKSQHWLWRHGHCVCRPFLVIHTRFLS